VATISVYTCCTNAIRDEFFIIEGIKSALLFADEVVVLDGGSEDSTIEQVKSIGDERVKVFSNQWLDSLGKSMYAINKSLALGRCTSDWCILMDSDEVFHEEDVERIKKIPIEVSDNIIAVEFNTLHFYKNYNHLINGCPDWKDLYTHKVYMVRNNIYIHHGTVGMEADAHVDLHGQPIQQERRLSSNIRMFHYGHVRTKESYVKKDNKLNESHEGWNFKPLTEESFEWLPDWKLNEYKNTHPAVMKDRIAIGTDDYAKIINLYGGI